MLSRSILILLLLYSATGLSKSKLPLLATKQAVDNLRFIASDGSFTYYQNREGNLLLSTNYKVFEVISGQPGTQYQLNSSPSRRFVIATQRSSLHKHFSLRQMLNIYKLDFGGGNAKLLGTGLNPKLHLGDNWVSYYHPISKTLKFVNLNSTVLSFEISIKNKLNPYFVPEAVMANKDTIIYTDLNNKGIPGILYYDKITKKTEVLYKASNSATKFELCQGKDEIFLGEFGLDEMFKGSAISAMKLQAIDFSKRELLYESPLNDIGNIYCEKGIYFIQNLSKKRGKEAFEVVELSRRDKRVKIISDVNFASQIIDMDGVLLLPHLGNYYVLRGLSDYTKTDLLKKRDEEK